MAQLKRVNEATGEQWGFGDDEGLVGSPSRMGDDPMDRTPPSLADKYPGISDPFMGRGSDAPRFGDEGRGDEGPRAALRKPGASPSPSAGNSFQSGGDMGGGGSMAPSGVSPFNPLPSAPIGSFAQSRQGGLFGSLGGLKGGGLGVPMDSTPDAASDPINTLLKLLMGGGQG